LIGAGAAVEAICKTAADKNADLILMGTEGANEIEGFFIGTVSEKVSRKAPCPVLVVPDDLKSYEIDTVCLALDTDNVENTIILDLLVQLLKAFNAKLRIIHISENGDAAFKKEEVLAHYKKSLDKVEHSFHVFYDENPNEGISEFLEKYPIELMALLYREHGVLERLFQSGTRKKMVFKTDIPLLILK
jgi:nucleotide-binding universal stress UspA family protein